MHVEFFTRKKLLPSEVKQADTLLLKFCRQIESVYDKTEITPNMHMHAHLYECILDYGPLRGFWLFSFKRYNGVLGRVATNNCSVEHQFMQRFLEDNDFLSILNPIEFSEEFLALHTIQVLVLYPKLLTLLLLIGFLTR